MRKTIAVCVLVLFCPTAGLAGRGHRETPPAYYDGSRFHHPPLSRRHHHDDGWIVPLAVFGGVLGILALSQMTGASQPSARPICRDTYHHYDEYGNYLYSRYVDRPCDD
jgi:hypothetical protein